MRLMASLAIAFATYSRIPMPRVDWRDENRRYAFCFFPLIGLVIGGAGALWLLLCGRLELAPLLRGGGAACVPLLVTGGIHMDGFISLAAALIACRICPEAREFLLPSHASRAPGAQAIARALGLRPVIAGEMALGEGTGAAMLFPLLDMAARVYGSAHTFDSLGMAAYTPQGGKP